MSVDHGFYQRVRRHAQHMRMERLLHECVTWGTGDAVIDSTYGEYLCTATVCAYTCAYCSELRGPDQDLPDWPCETATYLYSAEELGGSPR